KSVRDGFFVGVLNPKGLVFFAAILPGFIDHDSKSITAQIVLMGVTFSILAFFSDSTWGLIAGTIRESLSTKPARLVKMRKFGGLVMICLGLFTISTAF
ncbi:MAG: LysE family transporter, partial [Acidobacteria bacterium]|nr:LysE family transporter [Acidobacteriota bacterium]